MVWSTPGGHITAIGGSWVKQDKGGEGKKELGKEEQTGG